MLFLDKMGCNERQTILNIKCYILFLPDRWFLQNNTRDIQPIDKMMHYSDSELVLNADGSIFHLHLRPEHLANKVILVGDPERVNTVAGNFNSVDFEVQNREFRTITGRYKGTPLSVISTGIGTDNIDIVLNELDALVNIDLLRREPAKEPKSLDIIRIGTTGTLQTDILPGSHILSKRSIGFDGLIYHYARHESVRNIEFENALLDQVHFEDIKNRPYMVDASPDLFEILVDKTVIEGITISTHGFYGPQNRQLRLEIASPEMNRDLEKFTYKREKITNFEMESSAIYALGKLQGHRVATICLVLANRQTGQFITDYKSRMDELIRYVLEKINR